MNYKFLVDREKIGLFEQYDSGIFRVSLGDSLRSWFVTKCNRIDYGFGHALAGHDQYMKRYDRLTLEDKIELYLKAEKSLQVFEYLDDNNEKKIKELEQKYEITNKKLELVLYMIENSQKNKSQIIISREKQFLMSYNMTYNHVL